MKNKKWIENISVRGYNGYSRGNVYINSNNIVYDKNKWHNYYHDLEGCLLTDDNYQIIISEFLSKLGNSIDTGDVLHIVPKAKFDNNTLRSISDMRHVKKEDLDNLIYTLVDKWRILSDEYHNYGVIYLLIVFMIDSTGISKTDKEFNGKDDSLSYIGKSNLPDNTNFSSWGKTKCIKEGEEWECIVEKYKWILNIKIKGIMQEVKMSNIKEEFQTWVDELGTDSGKFIRRIDNTEVYYENNVIKLFRNTKQVNFIKKLKKDLKRSKNKIIAMDIETYIDKDKHVPYCVSVVTEELSYAYYLTDYKSCEDMLTSAFIDLYKSKYNNSILYFHNFSKFDSLFIITPILRSGSKLTPKFRDNSLIELSIKYKNEKNKVSRIVIRDSYLILTASLESLGKELNLDIEKTNFPHYFVNSSTLNYIGKKPGEESNLNWNLREECIKYCINDSKLLYNIMSVYWDEMYDKYRINISKYPTISSIALSIYRMHFLKDHKIPILTGGLYKFIYEGYTGGSVDVIKPYGKGVYHYDVNSLYPYVMSVNKMPIGTPVYFEGNILEIKHNAFGIFKAIINTPANMNIPLLQIKDKNRTISPLGKWVGVYLSEELIKAKEKGYEVTVISGIEFESGYIFDEYVEYFYKVKKESKPGEANNRIAKLMLNSLYGRFGMSPRNTEYLFSKDHTKILSKYKVINTTMMDAENDTYLYEIELINSRKINMLPISIGIAMAITAYGRLYMHEFKDENLLYTDTDSIFTTKMLDNAYIGDQIGLMKLEGTYDEAVFLSPKVYATKKSDGKEVVKIKGYKDVISFYSMKELLKKDKQLILNQNKWYRSIEDSTIFISKQVYTLMITENKRVNIYDNNIFKYTIPIKINK